MIRLLRGNVFDMLPTIAPGSVDMCVTSPPYWMLRSYLPKGHPLKSQELGSEPTPAAFVDNLVRVFRLVRDTMADHAVAFVNIGDTYATGNQGGGSVFSNGRYSQGGGDERVSAGRIAAKERPATGIPAGNLCLIPQRLALALQDDGWLVRSVVCWHKPAPMPASLSGWAWRRCRVKVRPDSSPAGYRSDRPDCQPNGSGVHFDERRPEGAQWSDCPGCLKCEKHGGFVLRKGSWRPTSSWEPILMLAKTPDYFCDGEGVKQPPATATISRNLCDSPCQNGGREGSGKPLTGNQAPGGDMRPDDPYAMANLRDVWTIAAEPLREKHYAAFPSELVLRCIRAGTSLKGYCPSCGKPWCRVLGADEKTKLRGNSVYSRKGADENTGWDGYPGGIGVSRETLDWRPSCSCPPAPPRPGLVLDPFAGSGRTLLTARRLGLDAVGVELNPEYAAMATRLIEDDSPLFNQVETVSTQPGLTPGTEGRLSEFALRAEAEKS